jgi:hypothetical protein
MPDFIDLAEADGAELPSCIDGKRRLRRIQLGTTKHYNKALEDWFLLVLHPDLE